MLASSSALSKQFADRFAKSIGATWNREVVHDTLQAVKVSFIRGSDPSGAAVELVSLLGRVPPWSAFCNADEASTTCATKWTDWRNR
jgi:hypothetical protein